MPTVDIRILGMKVRVAGFWGMLMPRLLGKTIVEIDGGCQIVTKHYRGRLYLVGVRGLE